MDNQNINKDEFKKIVTSEPTSLDDAESQLQSAIDYTKDKGNAESISEVAKEISTPAEKTTQPTTEDDFVFEIQTDDENKNDKKVYRSDKPEDEDKDKSADKGTKTAEQIAAESAAKTTIDDNTILKSLQEKDPAFKDFNSLDDIKNKVTSAATESEKAVTDTERKTHIGNVLLERLPQDETVRNILETVGLDELPNKTQEDWEDFAGKNPSAAKLIIQRNRQIAIEEGLNFDKIHDYKTKVPAVNNVRAVEFATEVKGYAEGLLNIANAKDFKPLPEDIKAVEDAVLKFINNGQIPDKYFDSVRVGKETFKVLDKDKMFSDFIYKERDLFSNITKVAAGRANGKEIQRNLKNLKDKTSSKDLAAITNEAPKSKIVNPKNRDEYEQYGEAVIEEMLEQSRSKLLSSKKI